MQFEENKKDEVGDIWKKGGSLFRSAVNYDLTGEPDGYVKNNGVRFIKERMVANKVLVDFGCWGGRHIGLLKTLDTDITIIGLDGDWAFVRLAQVFHNYENDAKVIVSPYRKISNLGCLADESVDGGLCWRVLHCLVGFGELEEGVREMYRVLKPNSPLVIGVRFVLKKQNQKFSYPQLLRTRVPGGLSREDLYFTKDAAGVLFTRFGFQVHDIEKTCEREIYVVNGKGVQVENNYLALHLTRL